MDMINPIIAATPALPTSACRSRGRHHCGRQRTSIGIMPMTWSMD
jgi:hypothetical protein